MSQHMLLEGAVLKQLGHRHTICRLRKLRQARTLAEGR